MPAAKTNRDYHTTRVKSAPEHRAVAAAGLADGQREYFNGLLGQTFLPALKTALVDEPPVPLYAGNPLSRVKR